MLDLPLYFLLLFFVIKCQILSNNILYIFTVIFLNKIVIGDIAGFKLNLLWIFNHRDDWVIKIDLLSRVMALLIWLQFFIYFFCFIFIRNMALFIRENVDVFSLDFVHDFFTNNFLLGFTFVPRLKGLLNWGFFHYFK